jgi:hypothetical protein
MNDETDFDRAERIFAHEMKALELVSRLVNPEVVFHKPAPSASIIDLRRRYDIAVNRLPTLFRQEQWEAIDRVTFDHDPESRWHIVGRGEGPAGSTEAVQDLLAQIAAEVAKGDAA